MKKTWFKIIIIALFLISFARIALVNLPWIYSSIGPDFTQVWKSANDLVTLKEPYFDPNLDYPNAYPPVTEIFFLPFTLLSHQMALIIFTYISFATIIGSVFLSLKIAAKRVPWPYFLLFIALSFGSFPIRFTLGMGQVNVIVLFLLLLSVYLETKPVKNSISAGLFLGLAIAIKPIFAFFLLFLAIKKSWKIIFASILTVGVLIAASLIFWSPHIWITWYESGILPLINYTSPQIYVYQNQGVFGFFFREISNPTIRIYLDKAASFLLVSTAAYIVFKKKDFNLGLSFFIITLLLFDLTSWQHHFVWAMFPFVVLFINILKSKNLMLLTLLGLSYFLISWNIKYDYLYPKIILNNQFYGALILYGINLYLFYPRQTKTVKKDKGSARYKIFEVLNLE
jgi:hypothetical protein